jgi:hypothetical protein
MATPHLERPEALGVLVPSRRGDCIAPAPRPSSWDRARTGHFTPSGFPHPLDRPRQVPGQQAMITGIVSLRNEGRVVPLWHDLERDLRPFLGARALSEMRQSCPQAAPRRLHLRIAGWHCGVQICHLLFVHFGPLDAPLHALNQVPMRYHGSPHRLIARGALLYVVPPVGPTPEGRPPGMRRLGPIETKPLTTTAAVVGGHARAGAWHQGVRCPGRLKACLVHGPSRRSTGPTPSLQVVHTWECLSGAQD